MSSARDSKNFRQLFSTIRSAERTIIFNIFSAVLLATLWLSWIFRFRFRAGALTVVPSWSLLFRANRPHPAAIAASSSQRQRMGYFREKL